MDPLYFLEHQFLPAVVYPGPDGKQISPFLLGNGFGPLCAGVLKDLPEAGEADGPSFQEADFSAEVRPVFCARIKINGSSTIPPISERAAVKVKGCT